MDNKIIANIKSLGIDMINKAESGHPGIVLGAAPIIYTIYAKHMNINTTDPNWISRDRFVMSAGHGSALLYSTLYMAGFDISIDDIKNFRRAGFKTPGHPEVTVTPGVDASTGPLGQGIATSVGMALGSKMLKQKFRTNTDTPLVDNYVYVLCGDGDLMEGVSYEAASLAGTLNLDNLIVLYDSNNISLDGDISYSFTENVIDRFKAMGWHTDKVMDGENVEEINNAIINAKKAFKPSLIEVKTIIGRNSVNEGKNTVHGKPLDIDDIKNIKEKLNIPNQEFYLDKEAIVDFRNQINERSGRTYEIWAGHMQEFKKEATTEQMQSLASFLIKKKVDLLKHDFKFTNEKVGTRITNGEIMNQIVDLIPNFLGGSADLSSSCNTYLFDKKDVRDEHFSGKNIWYGVREHSMGSISNGLALTGFMPFTSTFLAFSDYMKPSIRMSALMNLPVNYIFTHDSINIGSDGPTHQPIEQLTALRSIPILNVFRPADAEETIGCWNEMVNSKCPNSLILSRQAVKPLSSTAREYVKYGAYPVRREEEQLHGIIIATGTEVHTALLIADQLYKEMGLDLRVISMPCVELYLKQNDKFKNNLLPGGIKTIVIESGSGLGWHKFVHNDKYLITVDNFGISGTKNEVEQYCKFDFETIKERVKNLF